MPEVARFYGIIIKLFFGDHPPPHFHAVYGEYVGLFDIRTLEMFEAVSPRPDSIDRPRVRMHKVGLGNSF